MTDSLFAVAATGTGNLLDLNFTNGSTSTTGTAITTGLDIAATNSAAGAGGTHETYGMRLQDIAGTAGAGTQDNYGIRIGNYGQGSTETSYGLYVDSQTGSTNSYAAVFAGGNLGIGDTSPSARLEVGDGTDSLQISTVGDMTFVDADGAASITGSFRRRAHHCRRNGSAAYPYR
jgi:hypothetical protein